MTDRNRELLADAQFQHGGGGSTMLRDGTDVPVWPSVALAVISRARQKSRISALEEAAKVAAHQASCMWSGEGHATAKNIAAAIRALAEEGE